MTAGKDAARGPAENQTAAKQTERSVVNITDPQAIRALAHRVRLDVIDELFGSDRTYTATELAGQVGLTPSAMSYHLRALEKWGYVVRAESTGDGRERRWKAAADTLNVGDKANISDLVSSTLLDVTLSNTRERVLQALKQADSRGANDNHTLMVATSKLRLTEDEAKEFVADYHRLVDRYRERRLEAPAAGEREQMHLTAIFVPEASRWPQDPGASHPG
ncbi:MAG TPA: helix-turn-helix domain-containing protein [Micrococcaceae bacterium]|nr:helix-turn-helix domain-containing protein [Micrococcaceae bacterium]